MTKKWLKSLITIVFIGIIALPLFGCCSSLLPVGGEAPTSPVSYVIVDTGQVKCYDNRGEIACPQPGGAFYGQDAKYQGNQPAYQDNGDGTVTDLNTGLMWQQDPGDKATYYEAVANASSLNLAGYDDWRLPTIKELYSLIVFSGTDPSGAGSTNPVPFIDTDYFVFEYGDTSAGERIIDSQFVSSTKYVSTTMGGDETVFGELCRRPHQGLPHKTDAESAGREVILCIICQGKS